MKSSVLISLFFCFAHLALSGQGALQTHANPAAFAATIKAENLMKHLTVLASDDYEGRETGTPGQRKAAEYIANYFKSLGLPAIMDGTYYQDINFSSEKWSTIQLQANGNPYKHLFDFYAFPNTNNDWGTFETQKLLFLGYGIDDPAYTDYQNIDVQGKAILIYAGEPMRADSTFWITGSKSSSDWSANFRKKLEIARSKGVHTVLIIDPQIQKSISDNRNKIVGGGVKMEKSENPLRYSNNIFISPAVAKEIIGKNMSKVVASRERITATGRSRAVKLSCDLKIVTNKNSGGLKGENVLGFIEGTDPLLKDEIVVVTAHYDHLGKKGESIFNGADDNASGTSTVMEVAKALNEAKKQGSGPRRSVLCLLVSGEEKGLLGSKYYVQHPVFPLENTVANVNVDMVGRVDKKHENNPNYIYVIGSDKLSSDLHRINEAMNKKYANLELDYTYNDPNDPNRYYYRSDHYNFAEKGIPAIFYFNGTHDDYHRPTDDIEKIDFEKMAAIGKLVFHTTWELANRDERIKVDVKKP